MGVRIRLPAGTTEALEARVQLDQGLGDPTGFTVDYALLATSVAAPTAPDWAAAAWAPGGPPYLVRKIVVGTAGAFRFWIRVNAGSETVIRDVGIVEFY